MCVLHIHVKVRKKTKERKQNQCSKLSRWAHTSFNCPYQPHFTKGLLGKRENPFPSDSISINNNNNRKKSMNFICNACKMNTPKNGKPTPIVRSSQVENVFTIRRIYGLSVDDSGAKIVHYTHVEIRTICKYFRPFLCAMLNNVWKNKIKTFYINYYGWRQWCADCQNL